MRSFAATPSPRSVDDANWVYWLSSDRDRTSQRMAGGIHAAPIEISNYLADSLFKKKEGGSLARQGIQVNVICPGFVRSRITDRNTCPMPFFMEADEAADVIIARLSRNIGLIAFPWPMRLAMWVVSALPERLSAWLFSRLPEKA